MLRGGLSRYTQELRAEVEELHSRSDLRAAKMLEGILSNLTFLLEATADEPVKEFVLYTSDTDGENCQILDFMLARSIEEATGRAVRMYGPEWAHMTLVQVVGRHSYVHSDSYEGSQFGDEEEEEQKASLADNNRNRSPNPMGDGDNSK